MSQLIYLNLNGHMQKLLSKGSNVHAIDQQVNFWVRLGKACINIQNCQLPLWLAAWSLLVRPKAMHSYLLPLDRMISGMKNTKNPIAL